MVDEDRPLDRVWVVVGYQAAPPPRRFPPGAFPPDFPPPRPLPPGQVPTRSFPTRAITPPGLPPGSYTPLRIQESTLLKGELIPNIWTFLKVLQKEQALNEIQITQMMAGQQASPQRRQYRESGQRILRT